MESWSPLTQDIHVLNQEMTVPRFSTDKTQGSSRNLSGGILPCKLYPNINKVGISLCCSSEVRSLAPRLANTASDVIYSIIECAEAHVKKKKKKRKAVETVGRQEAQNPANRRAAAGIIQAERDGHQTGSRGEP